MDVRSDVGISLPGRANYKVVMNIIRRALRMRSRRNKTSSNDISNEESVELSIVDRFSTSPISSDVASTSRDSLSIAAEAPSVYEDPFVAVTADGTIYVKYYYEFNPRTEFRPEDIHQPHVKKLARTLRISRLRKVYYAAPDELNSPDACKQWGISRNDVWWASHVNRQHSINQYYSVVLDDGKSIRAGCSVVNLEAFVECLRCMGLDQCCSVVRGLPSPPINRCKIPFIDEDDEGLSTV